jgi:hypothetical protein
VSISGSCTTDYVYVSTIQIYRCELCGDFQLAVGMWEVFFLEGPRSRCYGRTAAFRLFMQPYDEDKQFSSFFRVVEHRWNEIDRETEVLGKKPVPVPLCPPQIPHEVTRDRNRASVVGGRRLTD